MARTGLRFTERMQGSIACGPGDYWTDVEGGLAWKRFDFELRAVIDDVDEFVDSPLHPIRLPSGTVSSGHFGRCDVVDGEINLMVEGPTPDESVMRYRVCFRTAEGRELTLVGFKRVDGDRLHLWYDTTRVFAEIYEGHLGSGEAPTDRPMVAIGILEIPLLTFLIQLTTFRPHGPSQRQGIMGYLRFMVFFARSLAKPYLLGLFSRTKQDVAAARRLTTAEDVQRARARFEETV